MSDPSHEFGFKISPRNRYVFPTEPVDGIIDLTVDERPFYLNSYSGELSLDYPKAERKCKGGILAYVELLDADVANADLYPVMVRLLFPKLKFYHLTIAFIEHDRK